MHARDGESDPHDWVDREPVRLATGIIDFARSRFLRQGGGVERLTTREAEVLAFLVEHADQAVARDDLLGAVWGHHEQSLSRAVDAAMSRLRKKIEPDPAEPAALFTVHGHGYRLLVDAAAVPEMTENVETPRRVLDLGERKVELGTGFVEGGAGGRVLLTSRERLMLEALLRAAGGVVEGHKLARVGGIIGGRPALSTAISRLRAKIEPDPAAPRYLLAVRGEGYRLDAAPPEEPRIYAAEHVDSLRSLTRHVGLVLGVEDCVVYRKESSGFSQVAAFGPKCDGAGGVREPLVQAPGEGLVGHAVTTSRPVRIADVRLDERYLPDLLPAASELAVPIVHRGEVVGVIDSESPVPSAYDEKLEHAFSMLAAIAAPGFGKVSKP